MLIGLQVSYNLGDYIHLEEVPYTQQKKQKKKKHIPSNAFLSK